MTFVSSRSSLRLQKRDQLRRVVRLLCTPKHIVNLQLISCEGQQLSNGCSSTGLAIHVCIVAILNGDPSRNRSGRRFDQGIAVIFLSATEGQQVRSANANSQRTCFLVDG